MYRIWNHYVRLPHLLFLIPLFGGQTIDENGTKEKEKGIGNLYGSGPLANAVVDLIYSSVLRSLFILATRLRNALEESSE